MPAGPEAPRLTNTKIRLAADRVPAAASLVSLSSVRRSLASSGHARPLHSCLRLCLQFRHLGHAHHGAADKRVRRIEDDLVSWTHAGQNLHAQPKVVSDLHIPQLD